MREAILYLEYLLNMVDGNAHAKAIYQHELNQLKLHNLPEEENATREMKEQWLLERLSSENNVIYRAFYDSVKLELERAKMVSAEIKKRGPILTEAVTIFEKIKEEYQKDKLRLERRQLERAKIISAALKEREPILVEAEAAFQKIKAQYHAAQSDPVIAQEIQKHKQKAAQLIAREWKKRRNVTPEDFVRVESQEFELVEPV